MKPSDQALNECCIRCEEFTGDEVRTELPLILALARNHALRRVRGYSPPARWSSDDWNAELVQIATLAVLEAETSYNPSLGVPLESFAYRQARNALRTFIRRELRWARRVTGFPEEDETGNPRELGDETARTDYQHIEQCLDWDCTLARLQESDRRLLQQIALGKSEREIAQSLGISQPAVHKRLQRIRKLIDEWW